MKFSNFEIFEIFRNLNFFQKKLNGKNRHIKRNFFSILVPEYSNAIRKYATPIGCVWYFVNFVFRYIIVNGIGKNVYSDAMKEFTVRF